MKNALSVLMLCFSALVIFSACKDDDEPTTTAQKNIVELAAGNSDLSLLVDAIEYAELDDDLAGAGPFTVFAPNNAAFTAFLNGAALTSLPKDVVAKLLLNHVILGVAAKSTSLTSGYLKTMATYQNNAIDCYVNTSGGVKINGIATVLTADVEASNGVVHIVDKVIPLPTVVTLVAANPDYSSLTATLTNTSFLLVDYPGILSGAGPFTVFAPTNAAFTAFASEVGAAALNDANIVNKVLQYHVVSGANVRSSSLSNNQSVATLGGQNFSIKINGTAVSILDVNNRTSNITKVDIQADNGVIHELDKVLLPNL